MSRKQEQQIDRGTCGALECEEDAEMWLEFGVAPVVVPFCDRCGEEVV